MEFLKEHLGDELFSQVEAKLKDTKDVKLANLVSGQYVDKAKFDKAEADKKNAEALLTTANDTIKDLKKNNGDNETLQATIKTHETTISNMKKDHEKELTGIKIDTAIEKALAGAKHADLLVGKIKRDDLVIDKNGEVLGLDKQVETLRAEYKDFFTNPKYEPPGGNSTPTTKEQFSRMGYKERLEIANTNKELYDSLSQDN